MKRVLVHESGRIEVGLRVMLERAGIGVVVLAFSIAEVWHPTVLHRKKDAQTGLVVATHVGPQAEKTTLDTELLDDLPRIGAVPLGNIDDVAAFLKGRVRHVKSGMGVSRRGRLQIVGWLADPQSRSPGAALFPIIDGRRLARADVWYGVARPDVGAYYGKPALDRTGFVVRLPANTLAVGTITISLGLVSSDRRGFFLAPQALTLDVSH